MMTHHKVNKPLSRGQDKQISATAPQAPQQEQPEQRPFSKQASSSSSSSSVPRRSTDTRHLWKDAARRRTTAITTTTTNNNINNNNRCIRVTDAFYDRDALLLTLDQHGRHLIDKMAFCMRPRSLSPDEATEDQQQKQPGAGRQQCGPVLSRAAIELLSGRLTGPNLRRIEIECSLEAETSETLKFDKDVTQVFQQPKDEDTLLQLEGENPRRRLLADTWSALAANTAVRELSVDRFVPIWASSFHSPSFRAFLGRLERLDVSIFGSKNGHRCINTVPAYIDSLQSILKVLFMHCSSVKTLALHASQNAPLGARGHFHIPLSLKATQLPRLEHLSLKNCFIGFELAHFINAHMHTLESLQLLNCYSYRGVDSSSNGGTAGGGLGMAWAPFLEMITRPGAMKLRGLEIYDDYIPLTFADERLAAYDPAKAHEPRDVKSVRRAQQKDPKLRLFLYGYLRDYSGEPWMNKDAIISSFDAREDQAAYDKLMAVVEQNAAAGAAPAPRAGGQQQEQNKKNNGGQASSGSSKSSVMGSVEVVELPA